MTVGDISELKKVLEQVLADNAPAEPNRVFGYVASTEEAVESARYVLAKDLLTRFFQ
jgi:hypothetical protein